MCKRRACDWHQNLTKPASPNDGSQLVLDSIHIPQMITSQDAGHARQRPGFPVLHRYSSNYLDDTAKCLVWVGFAESKQPCVCAYLSRRLAYS